MHKKLIAQGAEAKLFLEDDKIIKNRFPKSYRIKEIDEKLRGFRTRREAKILQKLQAIKFPAPKVIKNDEKENLIIEKTDGKLIKDILGKADYGKLCSEIGKKVAILHNNSIIHGDLTTSNMILNKEIYFIDFGLSFFSEKAEDKAVDLHLLKEGLESKHYRIWEECFKSALETYKKEARNSKETLKRLEVVEKRGRYMRASLRARSQTTTVPKKEVKAILFDLDGVLVDSIDAWFRTFNASLIHFGLIKLSRTEFSKQFGGPIEKDIKKYFIGRTVEEVKNTHNMNFMKWKSYVKLFPQSNRVIQNLKKQNRKLALITNSSRLITSAILNHFKLKKYFKVVVTMDDVKRRKPAPDMILKACRILKVRPKNTILVGDTKNDMIAGKKAGCVTVGYKIKGDYRINDLKEIERFIYV